MLICENFWFIDLILIFKSNFDLVINFNHLLIFVIWKLLIYWFVHILSNLLKWLLTCQSNLWYVDPSFRLLINLLIEYLNNRYKAKQNKSAVKFQTDMNLSHSLLFINISVYNMLCWNYFESLCLTKCLHRFLGLLFHKTLKDGFYIQKNFNRSYNVCVAYILSEYWFISMLPTLS